MIPNVLTFILKNIHTYFNTAVYLNKFTDYYLHITHVQNRIWMEC